MGLNTVPQKVVFLSFLKTRCEYFFAVQDEGMCRPLGSEYQILAQSVDIFQRMSTGQRTGNGAVCALEGHSSTTGRT